MQLPLYIHCQVITSVQAISSLRWQDEVQPATACFVVYQDKHVLMPYFLAKELAGVLGHHCSLTGGKVQT